MHQNQAQASLNAERWAPHVQGFWFSRSGVQPECLHFWQVPRLKPVLCVAATPGIASEGNSRAGRAAGLESARSRAAQPQSRWAALEREVGRGDCSAVLLWEGHTEALTPLLAADSLRDRCSPKWSNVFFPLGTSTVQYRRRTDTVCDYIQSRYPQNSTDAEQGSAQGRVTSIVSHRPKVSKALSLRPWEPSWHARASGLLGTAFKSVRTSYPGGLTNDSTIKASQLSGLATSFRDNGSL